MNLTPQDSRCIFNTSVQLVPQKTCHDEHLENLIRVTIIDKVRFYWPIKTVIVREVLTFQHTAHITMNRKCTATFKEQKFPFITFD